MPNVEGAYCATDDLRLGDIRPPDAPENYVKNAAEEIDAAVGHLYKTPIEFSDPNNLANRPAILTLKKINYLLASGRGILDMAASGENTNQHAYGMGMLKEGLAMLAQLSSGEMVLTGATTLDADSDGVEDKLAATGPQIFNEDPESLVQGFYERGIGPAVFPTPVMPQPYGITPGPRYV